MEEQDFFFFFLMQNCILKLSPAGVNAYSNTNTYLINSLPVARNPEFLYQAY